MENKCKICGWVCTCTLCPMRCDNIHNGVCDSCVNKGLELLKEQLNLKDEANSEEYNIKTIYSPNEKHPNWLE